MTLSFSRSIVSLSAVLLLAATGSGCATTRAEAGALAGAGFGGTLGALIGSSSGHTGSGALLGAMAGAAVGGIAGDAEDAREERDIAIAQAQYERDVAARQAVTNYDLITMAEAGLSDQVILNSVQTRGGQFDLSPSAIIELKSRGVSENVILSIQRSSGSRRSGALATRTITRTPMTSTSTVYIVEPVAPRVGVYFGTRPYPRHRFHYHHHW